MGILCSCSVEFRVDASKPGQGYRVLEAAFELGLNRWDVDTLFKHFKRIEDASKGTITLRDFLAVNNITGENYCRHMFQTCTNNKDSSGHIHFETFVIAMWNFLTLDKDCLLPFFTDVLAVNCSSSDTPNFGGMQLVLQQNSLGIERWRKLSKARLRTYGHSSIRQIFSKWARSTNTSLRNIAIGISDSAGADCDHDNDNDDSPASRATRNSCNGKLTKSKSTVKSQRDGGVPEQQHASEKALVFGRRNSGGVNNVTVAASHIGQSQSREDKYYDHYQYEDDDHDDGDGYNDAGDDDYGDRNYSVKIKPATTAAAATAGGGGKARRRWSNGTAVTANGSSYSSLASLTHEPTHDTTGTPTTGLRRKSSLLLGSNVVNNTTTSHRNIAPLFESTTSPPTARSVGSHNTAYTDPTPFPTPYPTTTATTATVTTPGSRSKNVSKRNLLVRRSSVRSVNNSTDIRSLRRESSTRRRSSYGGGTGASNGDVSSASHPPSSRDLFATHRRSSASSLYGGQTSSTSKDHSGAPHTPHTTTSRAAAPLTNKLHFDYPLSETLMTPKTQKLERHTSAAPLTPTTPKTPKRMLSRRGHDNEAYTTTTTTAAAVTAGSQQTSYTGLRRSSDPSPARPTAAHSTGSSTIVRNSSSSRGTAPSSATAAGATGSNLLSRRRSSCRRAPANMMVIAYIHDNDNGATTSHDDGDSDDIISSANNNNKTPSASSSSTAAAGVSGLRRSSDPGAAATAVVVPVSAVKKAQQHNNHQPPHIIWTTNIGVERERSLLRKMVVSAASTHDLSVSTPKKPLPSVAW